jgi:hypothetical protein
MYVDSLAVDHMHPDSMPWLLSPFGFHRLSRICLACFSSIKAAYALFFGAAVAVGDVNNGAVWSVLGGAPMLSSSLSAT